jgi:hypothetical protein
MLTVPTQKVGRIARPFVPNKPNPIQNIENIVQIGLAEPTAVEVVDPQPNA